MISVADAARLLGLSRQRVALLCKQRRIRGARLVGRLWYLPDRPEIIAGARGPRSQAITYPPV